MTSGPRIRVQDTVLHAVRFQDVVQRTTPGETANDRRNAHRRQPAHQLNEAKGKTTPPQICREIKNANRTQALCVSMPCDPIAAHPAYASFRGRVSHQISMYRTSVTTEPHRTAQGVLLVSK